MKILTFNWHEPYLCMLSKIGGSFDVALPLLDRGIERKWDFGARPLPHNMRIISAKQSQRRLKEGYYDLVLCHNFKDMKVVTPFLAPIILIFHNKLSTELALGENSLKREKYLANIAGLADRAEAMVFVSKSKRDDWGFGEGFVISPGIDADDLSRYHGNIGKILRVGNRMKERDIMLGYDCQEKICGSLENTLLGVNPSISSSRPAKNWEELKSYYASHRLYLNTTLHPFEDGYNLAMLEAMATGCPIVSFAHPESPITSEVDGFLSSDIGQLQLYISRLLTDIDLAKEVGSRGRETALKIFDIERFKAVWRKAINVALKTDEAMPTVIRESQSRYGVACDTP